VIDGQELPRFVNPTITYGKVEDARVTAVDGTFLNPFDAP
jgi:hypothetical protein